MFTIRDIIPAALFTAGSYLSYRQSLTSAVNLRIATTEQQTHIEELKQVSAANEAYWSNKINAVHATISLYDSKIAIDLGTTAIVTLSHIALGMGKSYLMVVPFIPYVTSSMSIAYSQYTRKAQHGALIRELWIPGCSTNSFKETLSIASKIGASKSPEELGDFTARMYKLEDATNYIQLAVIGAAAWDKYREVSITPISSTSDSHVDIISPIIRMTDETQPSAPTAEIIEESPEELIAMDKRAIAVATASDSASGNLLPPNIDASDTVGRTSPTSSDPSPANTPHRRNIGDEDAIPSANICTPTRGFKIPYTKEMGIAVGSIATYVLLENIYSIASFVETSIYNLFNSERNIAVKEFIIATETAKQMLEIDILQHQFEVCSIKNPEVTMQLVDTYTTDACNDGNVFENLIMGKDGCKFVDPAL